MSEHTPTPLISCLCVTRARVPLLKRAIACFHAQSYPQKELVLLYEHDDHDTRAFADTLGAHRRITLKEEPGSGAWTQQEQGESGGDLLVIEVEALSKKTLGTLRNLAVAFSRGSYVCQWDDDDWYREDRLAVQMGALQASGRAACTLAQWLMYDRVEDKAYCSYARSIGWEGSLLCKKTHIGAYDDLARGEDTIVPQTLRAQQQLEVIARPELYVYIYHDRNTWDHAHFKAIVRLSEVLSPTETEAIRRAIMG